MIESIEIKNFRCFKDTKIAKFGLVNIFGGLNNSGKTTLLEAVFLIKNLHNDVVLNLRKLRNESDAFVKEKPENAWDTFFYQKNIAQPAQIGITDTDLGSRKLSLKCDESIDDFIDYTQEMKGAVSTYINDLGVSKKSVLHIDIEDDKKGKDSSVLIASNAGFGGHSKAITMTAFFLPATRKTEYIELAKAYERARYEEKEQYILKACQIIDKNIEKIEVFAIGEPIIYLTQSNGTRLPLSLFGDAIGKVVSFILAIIINPNITLLIDEIENGIHYTKQAELWEMLFKLAIEFNVQIFSTSHSLEMIKAFTKVAQQFPEQAAYFEMARSPKTGLIKGIRHDVNTLAFELDRNMTIRGE